ncbi:hypothetical protein F383_20778 [Gossypium arboreum]|uniref:Uncharacterized protein n=1 Tax=Gossypium arboreum TaxID=29729 RepID=A0A0B0NXM3_GOSAR|nr:hypothetical protein F383_20778 [Gossypium arboreum]
MTVWRKRSFVVTWRPDSRLEGYGANCFRNP